MIKLNVESLKKPNVNGFIKEIHVKWKDVVLNLLKKEKLLEMYVNNSIWKKRCRTLTRTKCSKVEKRNGCNYLRCCKTKTKNNKIVSRRCENRKSTCPIRIKSKCRTTKKGECDLRTCCQYKYSFKHAVWQRKRRTCKLVRKCNDIVKRCRRIKLVNNCYKNRCKTVKYYNGKVVSRKCTKGKKICVPKTIQKCTRKTFNKNCHYDYCCKTITFNGRIKSHTCVKKKNNFVQ